MYVIQDYKILNVSYLSLVKFVRYYLYVEVRMCGV